ncbi:NAD-dependent epimerase/dehydratase family protein [Sphingomonas sp.]|uniref:NAD-dependent epimerase/dehydratase family protein n=1 Tax=Sphingomonas sp. TaxID=28214 RepID=UPI00286D8D0D|nr:NAD-dependent epimerase/dehydratase family protein [Sphingomonas sp.]
MVPALILGVTGGTGFVGARLLDAALAAGHEVRALTRRAMPPRERVIWVDGSLEDTAALARLADGADAVIHIAGLINGRSAAAFDACNVTGTAAMLDAARAGGAKRFVHVSSLAAREPGVSLYGASKARSEALVEASGLRHAIVRPPAVYGPGDKETLELFRLANLGLALLPPAGRISVIHVDDLAALLLALADPAAPTGLLVEPDDGRAGGWTHRDFALALGEAVGRKPLVVPVPSVVMRAAASADQLLRRGNAKLTADRAAYFAHPDWVADPARAVPAELWRPQIPTPTGLAATAAWYRAHKWL